MPVSKETCQLCKMEEGHEKILAASKGNVGKAIVAGCITGIVGVKADPDCHRGFCDQHVAQLMSAVVAAIGIMAERAIGSVQDALKEMPELKEPTQGKDIN